MKRNPNPLRKFNKGKIRSRLVRKGLFTQFPVEYKENESINKLFRTILDHNLFSLTSEDRRERKSAFKWCNPHTSCVNDFNEVCEYASLEPDKVRAMTLKFLDKFFPEVFSETSCSFRL